VQGATCKVHGTTTSTCPVLCSTPSTELYSMITVQILPVDEFSAYCTQSCYQVYECSDDDTTVRHSPSISVYSSAYTYIIRTSNAHSMMWYLVVVRVQVEYNCTPQSTVCACAYFYQAQAQPGNSVIIRVHRICSARARVNDNFLSFSN
jgi:hypothetical protein